MANKVVPVGGEITVGSTQTILDEDIFTEPAILPDGSFVVMYQSNTREVMQRLYDANGVAQGPETMVTDGTRAASEPGILALSGGDYMIYWKQSGTSGSVVQAQIFDDTGTAKGGLIDPMAAETSINGLGATVLENGRTLLVWTEFVLGEGFFAKGQLIAPSGAPKGGVLTLDANVIYQQEEVEVTALADGGFVVVWEEYSGSFNDKSDIRAQRYDAKGNPVGSVEAVNQVVAGDQFDPVATGLANGGYVVTWWGSYNEDGDNWGTFARMYGASGAAMGGDIQVNTTTYSQQWAPTVEALPDGGWVAVWQSFDQDGSGEAIVGQRFTADGDTFGGEFIVNTSTGAAQWYAGVDVADDGSFVVTWQSHHNGGNVWMVMAQQYDGQLVGTNGKDVLNDTFGTDILYGLAGNDRMNGRGGDDLMEGAGGKDKMNGGAGNDTIKGGNGADTLIGSKGNDVLLGGKGNDVLKAGKGKDKMVGGKGADDFVFIGTAKEGKNIIKDFELGIDTIEVSGSSLAATDILSTKSGAARIVLESGTAIILSNVDAADVMDTDFLFLP
ncbi:MAG: calcium-binding protein [Marinibacterium sp.]